MLASKFQSSAAPCWRAVCRSRQPAFEGPGAAGGVGSSDAEETFDGLGAGVDGVNVGEAAASDQVGICFTRFHRRPGARPCLLDERAGRRDFGLGAGVFEPEGFPISERGGVSSRRLSSRFGQVIERALRGAHGVSGVSDPGDERAVGDAPLRTFGCRRIERGPGVTFLDECILQLPVVAAGAPEPHGVPGLDHGAGALRQEGEPDLIVEVDEGGHDVGRVLDAADEVQAPAEPIARLVGLGGGHHSR